MVRSFAKIVSLVLLLVSIAASQTTLFAETESNILYQSATVSDSDNHSGVDGPETLVVFIQLEESDHRNVDKLVVVECTSNILSNRLLSIRAPPKRYI